MTRLLIILFSIISISVPAFAKQQLEEDWEHLMSFPNGADWYYDINSIHKFKGSFGQIGVLVKGNNPSQETRKYAFIIKCGSETELQTGFAGTVYRENVTIKQLWYGPSMKWQIPQEGHVSGAIYNEFCEGK